MLKDFPIEILFIIFDEIQNKEDILGLRLNKYLNSIIIYYCEIQVRKQESNTFMIGKLNKDYSTIFMKFAHSYSTDCFEQLTSYINELNSFHLIITKRLQKDVKLRFNFENKTIKLEKIGSLLPKRNIDFIFNLLTKITFCNFYFHQYMSLYDIAPSFENCYFKEGFILGNISVNFTNCVAEDCYISKQKRDYEFRKNEQGSIFYDRDGNFIDYLWLA